MYIEFDIDTNLEFCDFYLRKSGQGIGMTNLINDMNSLNYLEKKPKLILSGTPISNNPLELWSQFRFLDPNRIDYYEYFKAKHMYTVYGNVIYSGLYNFINELSDVTYYIDKETVMNNMETPEENMVNINFSNDLEEYNKIKISNRNYFLKDKDESLIKIKLKNELINDTKKNELTKKCEFNDIDKEDRGCS